MNRINVINPATEELLALNHEGWVGKRGVFFPMRNGAFRFVQGEDYSQNFGFQWNKFDKTQIDIIQNNFSQSRERFFAVTGWDKVDLAGQNVLEVGSGAGRFSEVVLHHTKANLYSVDYSNAVEANYRNNGPHERLNLFQANIYELPFAKYQFDKVFCFGVLQHTPDFKNSVKSLLEMVKPGGELIIDFYPIRGWYTKIHAKYLFRPFTKRMDHQKLLSCIEANANKLISAYNFFDKIGVGKLVNRFLPVCDIKHTIPQHLDTHTLEQWVILDTFDMFSPAYDKPQKLKTVVKWFKEFGIKEVIGSNVKYGNNNTVTVVKGLK